MINFNPALWSIFFISRIHVFVFYFLALVFPQFLLFHPSTTYWTMPSLPVLWVLMDDLHLVGLRGWQSVRFLTVDLMELHGMFRVWNSFFSKWALTCTFPQLYLFTMRTNAALIMWIPKVKVGFHRKQEFYHLKICYIASNSFYSM